MEMNVQNLKKVVNNSKLGSMTILADLNIRITAGEFVSVVGPSGCGKTTLLEIVAGLQEKTEGNIMIDNIPIDKSCANRAIVFQQYGLFPWLTVKKNIEYGPKIRGVSRAQRRHISRIYIEMVGLEGFETHYPHELSGGMQQRVALARAMANKPDILLLDEPFSALDAQTRENCQLELLALWRKTHVTVLFVTHDIGEALYLSDRVFVMSAHPGTIQACIPVDLERPRIPSVRMTSSFYQKEKLIRNMIGNRNNINENKVLA
ncbi:ABC transporter ATP-binding protein [Desulfobacula sp.]|uniref:ABC transporter ATP-binding protein n=1 Tax=Desulfobacula sp. TaxID=2593537 RepID=UPI0026134B5A|nr:ABC transporter ATP-binding protein [Desulfobacula sp.]